MSPLYKPVTSNARMVPQRLKSIDRAIVELGTATAGQLNDSVSRLDANIAQTNENVRNIPIPKSVRVSKEEFGTASGGQVAKAEVTVPAGKSRVHVFAAMTGFYTADGARAEHSVFKIRINGETSPILPRVPDNMDTYHLLGNFSQVQTVTPGDTVLIEAICTAGKTLSTNGNWISLDAFLTFTN